MTRPLLTLLLAVAALLGPGAATAGDFDHSHAAWTAVLQAHAAHGRFDYAKLKADDAAFRAYIQTLAGVTAEQIAGWTREQKLAYYINAYNAYTVESIIDANPIRGKNPLHPRNSIRQINGVWDTATHAVGGESLTLDAIEHQKLRESLKEPRIHAAVNCASIGCPPLRDTAFAAATIDTQLDAAVAAWLRDTAHVQYDARQNVLRLSKIFEWFATDFAVYDGPATGFGKYDGVVNLLAKHLPEATTAAILKRKPTIDFLDYDWALNEPE
jgi:hypothetical protein